MRRHFVENSVGFVGEHRLLLGLLILASAADLGTTIRFMLLDGVDQEVHPIIRTVSTLFGPVAGPMIGKLGQIAGVLVVGIFFRKHAKFVVGIVAFLYAWAAWYNIWGVHLYTPGIVSLFE